MAAKGEEQNGFQIEDPEQLAQKTRIRELLSRRADVIDARDEAFNAMILGQISEEKAKQYYRKRVESLILDLWTKFENENLENGARYLNEEEIATVTVHPPDEIAKSELADGEETPDPEAVTIRGLKWLIENGETVTAEFTARRWNPPGEKTVVGEAELPIETLDKALIKCMEFIDEAGIDVSIEDSNDPLEI